MINDSVIKGVVAKIWRYAVALLFRLACYCDPDLPQQLLNELQDATDFVTIQVPKRNLGTWMHGSLHSRDYKESLVDFLKDTGGGELPVPENLDPPELRAPRITTEVVTRRIISQVNGYEW